MQIKQVFHKNLPNILCINKSEKKRLSRTKQMKDKKIMTAIIFTAADGWRAPIVLILMSTNPR